MSPRRVTGLLLGLVLFGVFLAACAPAVEPTRVLPTATSLPSPAPTATEIPTPEPEARWVEAEWPTYMRLGDSDVVRLSLIPTQEGYVARVEYEEHALEISEVEVPYQAGHNLIAVARLDAAGVEVSPGGDWNQQVTRGSAVSWRWTIYPRSAGRHRLQLHLLLRWEPVTISGKTHETVLWQGGLELRVGAPMGLAAPQARALGIVGIVIGGALVLPLAEFSARRRLARARARRVRVVHPQQSLFLEGTPAQDLEAEERTLMQAVFANYDRLVIETEFSSGYSGARTWLVQPIHRDGRAEAHTILKVGSRQQITAENANFEAFVRHTLPPLTARVQGPPVVSPGVREAALQYTFVGAPGDVPLSLRAFALTHSGAETARMIEERLFATFGPTWWMQRKPYTFLMTREYDHLLPVHLLLEPRDRRMDAKALTGEVEELVGLQPGDVVCVRDATVIETRPKRGTVTLSWPNVSSQVQVRIRIQDVDTENVREGQILRERYGCLVARRVDMLEEEVRRVLPDLLTNRETVLLGGKTLSNPLRRYEALLARRVQGTSSVIHGDLNLENVLVGPGDLVWLIDFAATREGHTLFDFARIEAELTAQVVAERFANAGIGVGGILMVLDQLDRGTAPAEDLLGEAQLMLGAVRRIAGRCLFDPAEIEEFRCALILAYIGALKFANLDQLPSAPLPKVFAYAAAAHLLSV